ncbi:SRPBCC family protein [Microbacterium istanbulense]|uniref:SRPBCC family protein n=1 Tax=Microbacterium istanbulense TaxID=3122049 RepID=A0ABU8LGW6_9MICO
MTSEPPAVPAKGIRLDVVARVDIAAPAEACFEHIVPVELSRIFRPYWLLPGVERTDERARWTTPGLSRTVYFTDGSRAEERLTTVEAPRSFTYSISGFTGVNRFLLSRIDGAWEFGEGAAGGTSIVWTYSLVCHNLIARAAAAAIVAPMLRRYLARALQTLKADLEAEAAASVEGA